MAFFTALALGLAAGGMVTSAIGQKKAGAAAKQAGEAQAQLEEFNAQVAELQATDAVARGADEESRFRSGVRGIIGAQRAGQAAGNIDVGFGSAVDVQADAAFLGELDALQIRTNAARESWGYKVQAEDRRKAADVARKGGQAAQTAARWGVASTLIGGGGSLLQARYGYGGTR